MTRPIMIIIVGNFYWKRHTRISFFEIACNVKTTTLWFSNICTLTFHLQGNILPRTVLLFTQNNLLRSPRLARHTRTLTVSAKDCLFANLSPSTPHSIFGPCKTFHVMREIRMYLGVCRLSDLFSTYGKNYREKLINDAEWLIIVRST